MAKGNKSSLIGSVGGVFIGAALLLFIATIILGSLKSQNAYGSVAPNTAAGIANRATWNSTNTTITTLMSFLTIGVILFGVLGITMVGAAIIGYITGAFA
jgi:nitrate reductase NapE component